MVSPHLRRIPQRWLVALAVAVALHVALLLNAQLQRWLGQNDPGADNGAGQGREVSMLFEAPIAAPAVMSQAVDEKPMSALQQSSKEPLQTPERELVEPPPERQSSRPDSSGGGGAGGYYARLRAHLQDYRRALPELAALSGRSVVEIQLNAQGLVLDARIVRSSGASALDREALALVYRASPVPPPPMGIARRLRVPLEFEAAR